MFALFHGSWQRCILPPAVFLFPLQKVISSCTCSSVTLTPNAGGAELKHLYVPSAQGGYSQAFRQRHFPTNGHLISATQLFGWSLNHRFLPQHPYTSPQLPACLKTGRSVHISESSSWSFLSTWGKCKAEAVTKSA